MTTSPGLVNTNNGAKFYICATATIAAVADAAAYAALTWIQVQGVGRVGEVGTNQPILTYPTWDGAIASKAKGNIDGGSPEIEVARDIGDAGQDALRAAALVNLPYPIKIQRNDKITTGGGGTILYYRALIAGPRRPQGQADDFDLEIFNLGIVQAEIQTEPT